MCRHPRCDIAGSSRLLRLHQIRYAGAIDEVQVVQAVVIEVEHRHTSWHCFDLVLSLRSMVSPHKFLPRACGVIGESNRNH
jgi:hypothetical protein